MDMNKFICCFVFIIFSSHFSFAAAQSVLKILPQIRIEPGSITVSGISSGAFMAVQMDVAASGLISGVASVAGGIYGCAQGNALSATQLCMGNPSLINAAFFVNQAKLFAMQGAIDSPQNLGNHKIYIFQSQADEVVGSEAANKLRTFYEAFTPKNHIRMEWNARASHGFPTLRTKNTCSQKGLPWLVNCGVDLANHLLTHLYGSLNPFAPFREENLLRFHQKPYIDIHSTMMNEGYLYVPAPCQKGDSCRLHVAFHGCRQSPEFVGESFVREAGYNEWAEVNRIVVLYPSVSKTILNPNGCWDWWGYTSVNYATKTGSQVSSIINMIKAIMTKPQVVNSK